MIETEEISLDKLSPINDKEEQRIMFEKAGLLLERLAHDSEKDENTVNIADFKLQKIISNVEHEGSSNEDSSSDDSSTEGSSTEDSSDDGSSNEEEQIDKKNIKASLEKMLKNKEEELEAIKFETDILFEGLSRKHEAEKDLDNEKQSVSPIKAEAIVDQETIHFSIEKSVAINEKTNTEINENGGKNSEQKKESEPKPAETQKKLNFVNEEEKTIHKMLSTVQSRQNLLEEKMVALKASTESLREQLQTEKEKLKEEINKTIELEKMIKNENQIKEQYMKQSWKIGEDDILNNMESFGDYRYFTNTTINFGMEIKKRNYQKWLSEIGNECERQLTTVQNNLLVLKPLKETVSKWSKLNSEETDLDYKSEETDLFDKGELTANTEEVEGEIANEYANEKEKKYSGNLGNEIIKNSQAIQEKNWTKYKETEEDDDGVENKYENQLSEVQKIKFDKNTHDLAKIDIVIKTKSLESCNINYS